MNGTLAGVTGNVVWLLVKKQKQENGIATVLASKTTGERHLT